MKGIEITTSYGKFLKIGIKEEKDVLFSKIFNPPLFFNGFNIQFNDKSITDIEINSIINNNIIIENKKSQLIDISNEYFDIDSISPIFQSDIIGDYDDNLEYENDIQKFHYIQEMKDNTTLINKKILFYSSKS